MESATPMLRQYLEIKKQYPGTILFFRLGDFYEMFNEDAVVGSRELDITLTARQKDSPNPVPMCGVPHHAAASYIAKLVKKGYRVAICDQTEAPQKGVKLVKREVVRVITPGTAIDPQLIDDRETAYLCSVAGGKDAFAVAFLELSSGQFVATQFDGTDAWAKIVDEIRSRVPREIIFPASIASNVKQTFALASHTLFSNESGPQANPSVGEFVLTERSDDDYDLKGSIETLTKQFSVAHLSGYGLDGRDEAIRAAGACVRYALETQRSAAGHILEIDYFESTENMVLDAVTLRNLEIFESRGQTKRGTLFALIDESVTGMGSRLLKQWLARPLLRRSEIQTRLSAVKELGDPIFRDKVRFLLKSVSDIERSIGRLHLSTATPRDVLSIGRSLGNVPQLVEQLSDRSSLLLQVLSENLFDLPDIRTLIDSAIVDEPPINLSDGGVIRPGFNAELDELRNSSADVKQLIAGFEEREKTRTGISSLKVRFNNVFGYYIEISKSNLAKTPDDYERRQTLANAERFTTPQLKEWEQRVLGADDQIIKLETELFASVRAKICAETRAIQSTARAIATLDALAALAESASRCNFTEPELHDGDEIEIKNGRHPVVEASAGQAFIPNDAYLNNSSDRLLVVTGANMGGKSTLLRQIAIIQILAQIGSFVPASRARLPILDRIWTRVGASDDLASGRSTFMVEMTETASILHNATPRSLVLLDEIGRGTSTFDGLSIAWSVAEFLHNSPEHSAKTIFATHYHELTELAESLPGAKNYQMTATETEGDVVFLHKLQPGKASKSYGIAVAKLAGLPTKVIERAKAVLTKLEQHEIAVFGDASGTKENVMRAAAPQMQATLFSLVNDEVVDELKNLDLASIDAERAEKILRELKERLV